MEVLRAVPAFQAGHPVAGLGAARRVLRVVLLRAAVCAVQLAARLEQAGVPAEKEVVRFAVRRYAPVRPVGVRVVEAAVCLAVAAYFVAGLVGVFVA